MVAASTHSSHHSAHRPTSIVRGIPAEEKPLQTATYTTTEHHTVPVTYTSTAPTELPAYYAATQAIEAHQPHTVTSTTQTSTSTADVISKHLHTQQIQPSTHTTVTTGHTIHSTPIVSVDHTSHNLHTAVPSSVANLPRSSSTPYGDSYTQETRKISSVVVESTLLGDLPQQDGVRYVEVPTVEEQVKIVTRKEVREIEKIVSRPEIEWVERVVVVPRVEYVDKPVEVEVVQFHEVVKKVPSVVEVPKDVVIEKKVVIPRVVEQLKEVPGPVITRNVPYTVEKAVEVLRPVNREVPVIVAQTIKPVITESSNQLVVDAFQYEPEIVPVDVHLARPVATALEVVGKVDERHKLVTVSAAQYNTILKALNTGADERVYTSLPFIQEHGSVPFCNESEATFIIAPEHVRIEGWVPTAGHSQRSVMNIVARDGQELETMKSMHSATVPAGARCCGPSGRAPQQTTTTTTTTSLSGAPVRVVSGNESQYVQRGVSVPGTEHRTVVTEEKTMTYDEQHETAHGTRSEQRIAGVPEGGSIRSHVEVVPSQHGTLPVQRSRVCC